MNRALLMLLVGLLMLAAACETDDPEEDVAVDDDPEEEVDDEVDDDEADDDYDIGDQPDDAAVAFTSPEGGDTVDSPVELEFEVEGVELVEAGAPAAGEAHIHVLVDRGCFDDGEFAPGPSDEAEADGIFHLSDGSDATELDLEPGERELCAQLGDGVHQTFGETDEILITVE